MAHYAFLDENNIVTTVIVGIDETDLIEGIDPETWYENFRGQNCKRTSYNTYANQHILGGEPFRKNYAGIGDTYDEERDAFIPPKTFPSFILDENTCNWNSPVAKPELTQEQIDNENYYIWNEEILNWELMNG